MHNNNNNDIESNGNCSECAKKIKINSTSVAVQCEVDNALPNGNTEAPAIGITNKDDISKELNFTEKKGTKKLIAKIVMRYKV